MIDILLSEQLLAAAIITGTLYALVALGLNLVYGTMRLLNIAHGELVMLGAYVASSGYNYFGISPLVGVIGAGVLTGLMGAAVYIFLFRNLLVKPELSRRLEANSLLIFFGAIVILQNIVALAFTGTPRGYRYLDGVIHFGGVALTENRLAGFLIAAAICLATAIFLRASIVGVAIKALIQDRRAAGLVGINVDRIQLLSLTLGFSIGGVAGALVSMTQEITPFMGFPYTMAAFVVIILGGLGNLVGGIAAGLVLGFIQIYGVALTSPQWNSILLYGAFVAVLVLRPQGIMRGGRGVR